MLVIDSQNDLSNSREEEIMKVRKHFVFSLRVVIIITATATAKETEKELF